MKLCRVVGNVVSTHKEPRHRGYKLMMVQPIDEKGNDISRSFLSFDTVSAGPGDIVLVEQEGNAARQLLGTSQDPFHSVIVGIADWVGVSKEV